VPGAGIGPAPPKTYHAYVAPAPHRDKDPPPQIRATAPAAALAGPRGDPRQKTRATMMMMTMRAPMLIVTLRPMSSPLLDSALP
jgi:hypothetical protein